MGESLREDAKGLAERFARRVLAVGQTADGALTPLEERLMRLAQSMFLNSVVCAQIARMTELGLPGLAPITAEIVAEGARFALAAAVEIEQPLRKLRDTLEERGNPSTGTRKEEE